MKLHQLSYAFTTLATLFETSCATTVPRNVPRAASNGYNNIVYFPNWDIYGRNYQPAQLPIQQLTHVMYAFANIQSDGTVVSSDSYADLQKHYPNDSWNEVGNNAYGCVKQLYLLKQQNRNLKVLLSIGGWTYSPSFAAPLSTAAGRSAFVNSSVTFVQDWGLDGIDIDYEYPANASAASDSTQLLQELRDGLDAYTANNGGNRQLISLAMPAGPTNYQKLDLKGMTPLTDLFNIMAYDYDGSFGNFTGHQANLYNSTSDPNATPFNTKQAVDYFISQGVPSQKINLGMPVYGRSFTGTKGLGQPFTGVGSGSWQDGVWDYKVLPQPGATEMTDSEAGATYSWDATNEILISYDTVDMVKTKIAYELSNKLGGSMFWEASSDRNDSGSLIGASWSSLSAVGAMDSTQNTLSYPASQYDNIKNGMGNSTTNSTTKRGL